MRFALSAALLWACNSDKVGLNDTASAEDTGEGGGGTEWDATGSGTAYFADGTEDNSLFHLELTRASEPEDGKDYYGFVSVDRDDVIELGEIALSGEDVIFEGDIGVNAVIEGYDTFEAWQNDSGDYGQGDPVWAGQIDPTVYETIQELLIESDDTPDGEGSLRALETAVQSIRLDAIDLIEEEPGREALNTAGEGYYNAIEGAEEDINEDGTADVYGDDPLALLGDDGYVGIILADLAVVAAGADADDPINDLAEAAYDCTQNIEYSVGQASLNAGSAAASAAEGSAQSALYSMIDHLLYALEGFDANEDDTIDPESEGTIECAIDAVSQMAVMDVTYQ